MPRFDILNNLPTSLSELEMLASKTTEVSVRMEGGSLKPHHMDLEYDSDGNVHVTLTPTNDQEKTG
jgi:hypothetical protein